MAIKPGSNSLTDTIHLVYVHELTDDNTIPSIIGNFGIEYVRSNNGGTTWSTPVVIGRGRNRSDKLWWEVQFPVVAIDPRNNTVYVAWEEFGPVRTLRVRKSNNGGMTWGSVCTIASINAVGSGSGVRENLQGKINAGSSFSLVVNPANGHVYVCYHQGEYDEFDALSGLYRYSGIYFRRSTDGGTTWSAAARINNDQVATPFDQFQPGIAVSRNGSKIGIVYYDRRSSSANFNMQVYYASINPFLSDPTISANWVNTVRTGLFPALGANIQDDGTGKLPWYGNMGNYNDPCADTAGINTTNIIGAWTSTFYGNQDVWVEKLP